MEGSRAAKGKVTATPLRRSRRRGTQDEEHKEEEASGGESQKIMEIEVSGGESQKIMEEDKVEKVEKEHNGDQGEEKMEDSDKAANGQDESSGHTDPPGGEGEEQRPPQDKEGGSLKRKRETPASVTPSVPRGKPKSGRVWKENKKRFSDMVKDRPLRTSWDIKMKQRQEKKLVKTFAQQLKDDKRQEKEEKRKRREENLRRRLENERKAEIVQVIRNPTKLKRARKKQLRNIEKRDTLMMTEAGKKVVKKEAAPAKAKNKPTTS